MILINQINGKFLLAVSGGVDSIVLLDIFSKIYNKKDLIIAHFNHNIRGEESDFDELFVRDLSKKYGIKFYSEKVSKSPKSEEEARDLRYEFLFKILKKEKCTYVVTAQHKDDQIETLMLQLIRGTGNFSPMKEFSTNIYRPFLEYSKQKIISYAKDNDLKWREDSTNKQDIYTRNKLRNNILPKILQINSNFGKSLLRFSKITCDSGDYIDGIAKELLNGKDCISKAIFDGLHISIKRAIIRNMSLGILSFKNIEEILEMIYKGMGGKEKHGFKLQNGIICTISSLYLPQGSNYLQRIGLILASASPQRKRLLSNIVNNFIVIPSKYEEKWDKKKTIEENAIVFAEKKALNIARKYKGNVVIGCDTFVVHQKYGVYMKPGDFDDAKKQLKSYSQENIRVISGLSVILFEGKIKKISKLIETNIKFDKISDDEIDIWLSKNEWQGRSGSCSIEGYASKFVQKIDGCFFNIVGLPVYELNKILKQFIPNPNGFPSFLD